MMTFGEDAILEHFRDVKREDEAYRQIFVLILHLASFTTCKVSAGTEVLVPIRKCKFRLCNCMLDQLLDQSAFEFGQGIKRFLLQNFDPW